MNLSSPLSSCDSKFWNEEIEGIVIAFHLRKTRHFLKMSVFKRENFRTSARYHRFQQCCVFHRFFRDVVRKHSHAAVGHAEIGSRAVAGPDGIKSTTIQVISSSDRKKSQTMIIPNTVHPSSSYRNPQVSKEISCNYSKRANAHHEYL